MIRQQRRVRLTRDKSPCLWAAINSAVYREEGKIHHTFRITTDWTEKNKQNTVALFYSFPIKKTNKRKRIVQSCVRKGSKRKNQSKRSFSPRFFPFLRFREKPCGSPTGSSRRNRNLFKEKQKERNLAPSRLSAVRGSLDFFFQTSHVGWATTAL